MKLRPWMILGCALAMSGAFAEEPPEARAARYYAEGLDLPLLQLRTGALLVQACTGRMRKGCDAEQIRLAADNRVITLLDVLTLFPQRPDTDPAAGITRPKDLKQKINDTSAALLRAAGEYDRKLFAKFGSALYTCPPSTGMDTYASSLDALMLIDVIGFQGVPLDEAAAAVAAIHDERDRELERWRKLPVEECLAARKLGEYLMQLMNSKLGPFREREAGAEPPREFDFDKPGKEKAKDPDQAARNRELAQTVAGNFVSVVATELQLAVFPESAARIKEIADAAGFPSQD